MFALFCFCGCDHSMKNSIGRNFTYNAKINPQLTLTLIICRRQCFACLIFGVEGDRQTFFRSDTVVHIHTFVQIHSACNLFPWLCPRAFYGYRLSVKMAVVFNRVGILWKYASFTNSLVVWHKYRTHDLPKVATDVSVDSGHQNKLHVILHKVDVSDHRRLSRCYRDESWLCLWSHLPLNLQSVVVLPETCKPCF